METDSCSDLKLIFVHFTVTDLAPLIRFAYVSVFTCLAVHLSAVWVRVFWCDEVSPDLHPPSTAANSHKCSPSADTSPSPRATQHHIAGRTAQVHTLHLMAPSGANRHTIHETRHTLRLKTSLYKHSKAINMIYNTCYVIRFPCKI